MNEILFINFVSSVFYHIVIFSNILKRKFFYDKKKSICKICQLLIWKNILSIEYIFSTFFFFFLAEIRYIFWSNQRGKTNNISSLMIVSSLDLSHCNF